jgi:hypothetical protein
VRVIARTGAQLAQWTSPRQITAAAFDGTRLAIADRAAITSFDVGLVQTSSGFLVEECASGVLLSCGRFVCGNADDSAHVFYTFDLATGAEIARSISNYWGGTLMRRVPGVEAFATVSVGYSPADFFYYRAEPSGRAVLGAESPYHGAFAVNEVYAFHGSPALYMVTSEGRYLRLDDCLGATYPAPATGCLTLDGTLGTLIGTETFVAMETGADGKLYTLTGTPSPSYTDTPCTSGCRVQRIDLDTHLVLAQVSLPSSSGIRKTVRLRHDPWAGRVLLGNPTGCSTSYPYACTGFSVVIAAY